MAEVATGYSSQTQRTSLSACAQCKKRHVACDFERPCSRCKDRKIECTEAEHKKRGPKFRKTAHVYPEPSFHLDSTPFDLPPNSAFSATLPFSFDYSSSTPSNYSSSSPTTTSPFADSFSPSLIPPSDNLTLLYLQQQQHQLPSQQSFNPFSNSESQQEEGNFSLQNSNSSNGMQWDSSSFSSSAFPPSSSPSSSFSPSSSSSNLLSFTPQNDSINFSEKEEVEDSDRRVVNLMDLDPSHHHNSCEAKMTELGVKLRNSNRGQCDKYQDRVKQLKNFLTEEQRKQLRVDFNRQLKTLTEAANEIEFPILIWTSGGVIAHVNEAFRESTGWNAPVPTKPEEHALFQILSKKSLISFHRIFPKILGDEIRRFSMDVVFKRYNTENEEYVSGTAAVTLKRDIFGLPQLFHCQFIPQETLFDSEDEDEDLSPPISSSPLHEEKSI
jgi:PAS domain-containing protein